MASILTVPSNKAVNILGKDQAARVTNSGAGTLYVGGDTVTSSSNDYSIATTASRLVFGPKWGIQSSEGQIVLDDIDVPRAGQSTVTPTRFWLHGPKDTSTGTDTTVTADRAYIGQITIPVRTVLTGIGFLIGGTGGTHKAVAALWDRDGKLVASSASAGVTVGTLNTYQDLPFITPVEILAPGKYYVGIAYSGTTPTLRTAIVDGVIGGTVNSVSDFSTPAVPIAITPPTTAAATNTTPQGLYLYT